MHSFSLPALLSVLLLTACAAPENTQAIDATQNGAPAKKIVVTGSRIPQNANIPQVGVTSGTYDPQVGAGFGPNGSQPH